MEQTRRTKVMVEEAEQTARLFFLVRRGKWIRRLARVNKGSSEAELTAQLSNKRAQSAKVLISMIMTRGMGRV